MKIFIKRVLLFLIIPPVVIVAYYNILDYYYNSKKAENSIFIWGDSQAYRGINLVALKDLTGKNVYTAAKLGAGVYDFLRFSVKVPKNSTVVVTVSKPAQIRSKERDRNLSGISISSLKQLYDHNYSINELYEIVEKNIIPKELYVSETELYPNYDSIVLTESVAFFEENYKKVPDYLADKQLLYLEGFKKLIEKNCKIILVEFPYHEILNEIENKSGSKEYTIEFTSRVIQLFDDCIMDTINLNTNKAVMFDLTHLNEHGATLVTEYIAKNIKDLKSAMIFHISLIRKDLRQE